MRKAIYVSLVVLCFVTGRSFTEEKAPLTAPIRARLIQTVPAGARDMDMERRQISGFGTEPCKNSCWHEAHGFRRGDGGDFGPFHPTLGPISLPAGAFGKNP